MSDSYVMILAFGQFEFKLNGDEIYAVGDVIMILIFLH